MKADPEQGDMIRKLNAYIHALMDGGFSYSIILDRDAKIVYYSDSLLQLTGLTDGNMFLNTPVLDVCRKFEHSDFAKNTSRRLSRILAGENSFFENDDITWPNGEKRTYRISYKQILDENGDFDGVLIFSHDVTDIRLEEAERRISDILKSSALPCLVWDEKGDMLAFNDEAARIFGFADDLPPERYNEAFFSIQPKFQPDGKNTELSRQEVIRESLKNGFSQITVQLIRYDGAPVYFTVNAARIEWLFERRLVIFFNDLTEKMQNEAAQAANEAKSRFLAHISHEIRTPINSVIGFTELAMDDEISSGTKEYLSRILESSSWLLQIINDLLDVAKIESGRIELETIPFSLQEVFNNCSAAVMTKAMGKGLTLFINEEPFTGKRLLGDPLRLSQVFINLLSNAVKFTHSGSVNLTSVVTGRTDYGVNITFEIKDSGIGMTPEQIKRIYEPFTQADASITRKYGGTGLGLPITKNILEMMGSELKVESIPGVGSVFSFELSFGTTDITDGAPERSETTKNLQKPTFKGEILVCEDNPMNQRVITEHLARVGLKTEIAENGKEGVEKVKSRLDLGEKPYDLIFMDIHMPVMDGLEAAPLINLMETGTPVIAMTADIKIHNPEYYKPFGMIECVGKPFSTQELWRCLLKYLQPPLNFHDTAINTDAEQEKWDGGNLAGQLRLDFVKNNQTRFNDIMEAIAEGDVKTAHRMAHTLKSSAALIGETALQSAAARIEALLKDGGVPLDGRYAHILEMELNAVLEELKPLLAKSAPPVKTDIVNKEEALALFDRLAPMLENINPECVNLLDKIRALPGTEELAGRIEDYDFESAAQALAELRERWQ